jgi:hypothetical protein
MRSILTAVLLLYGCTYFTAAAQQTTDTVPPYLKYKQLPAFQILMTDSSRSFNTYNIRKGKPSVLILFSPDCSHCEELTAMIRDSLQAFKEVNIVMATPFPLDQIKRFIAQTKLNQVSQITIGKDVTFFFWSFFQADTVPFIAVYDKNKTFVTTITRLKKIDELLDVLRSLK